MVCDNTHTVKLMVPEPLRRQASRDAWEGSRLGKLRREDPFGRGQYHSVAGVLG